MKLSPDKQKTPTFLTRSQVSQILGVSNSHIANLIDTGQLRAIDMGCKKSKYRCLRIPSEDVIRFLNDNIAY